MDDDIKLTKLASCAGCGAKVGAGVLSKLLSDLPTITDENLLVGFDKSDDAAVYKIKDDLAIVQTLDFFPPIADDPFTFGQIAATNALSDIYAMGGEPKLALNIMCVPKSMPKNAVHEILRGGYEKCAEAGTIICGGHSIYDDEPKYGLSVTGFVRPEKMWKNHGAKPGDLLFLTKPIGIGVLTAAQRGDLLEPDTRELMIRLMTTLNKGARDALVNFDVHACTDVTGFSFLGHLYEMCQGSEVSAEIDVDAISFIPEALDFARIGILPEGMYRNRTFAEHAVDTGNMELAKCDLLFDPQTSGGLLVAVPESQAEDVFTTMNGKVPCVQRVGRIIEKREKSIYLK
ncbi:MAG: selenide, water dikinase SelD [Clostridia bacterium]|nr:selenide, water dikinase SelD [Clostridia bacterium]